MPKIFEYFGFVFFFYSNEHEPIHVHVIHGDCQSVFELILENGLLKGIRHRSVKGYADLHVKDMAVAEHFIKVYSSQIIQKWVDFFVLKKVVKCTDIKTRL